MKKIFNNNDNINIAINFMVIEQTIRLMGLYDRMCDEHDALSEIFEKASNFELGTILREYAAKGNEKFIASYIELMHNLFGLDSDILLGQRQIDLGIGVAPKYEEIAFMDMDSLEQWMYENDLENAPIYPKYDATKVTEWERIETFVGHSKKTQYFKNDINDVVSATINNGIGVFEYSETLGNQKEAVESLKFNPLGINILGLFVSIYDMKYHMAEHVGGDLEERLDEVFENVFSPMNIVERRLKKGCNKKVLQTFVSSTYGHWNKGIYSLKSIITNLLIHGAPKEEYADKFENQLTKSGAKNKSSNFSNMKEMDKFYYHEELGGYLPFPLVLHKNNSELLELMRFLYQSSYNDGIEIEQLVYISTIKDELKYWSKKKEKYEMNIFEILKKYYSLKDSSPMSYADSMAISTYKWMNEIYIPALEEAQRQYDENQFDWAIKYIELLTQQLDKVTSQLVKTETVNGYQKVILENRKSAIQKLLNKLINMKKEAEKDGDKIIKPLILVKEPYYKENISLKNDYNNGEKRDSRQGSRKYTNNFI